MITLQGHHEKLSAMLAIYEAKLRGSSYFVFNISIYCLTFDDHGFFNLFNDNADGKGICFGMSEPEIYNFLVKNVQIFGNFNADY